ncbi:phage terminase small subunit-related protein, partial [Alicyclobacillus hesperidum]|uniref:phage terminase small subunit-related protein n=1 Tax=Alicyclobacillus hesperidum TaxID=89784 RepID=UPI00249331A2
MPRPRNPKRDEAKRIWLESGGQIALKNIAQQLGVSDSQVRNWKVADDWENSGIVAQQNMNRGATKRKPGA